LHNQAVPEKSQTSPIEDSPLWKIQLNFIHFFTSFVPTDPKETGMLIRMALKTKKSMNQYETEFPNSKQFN